MSKVVRSREFVELCHEIYHRVREKKEVWRILEDEHDTKVSYKSVLRALEDGVANVKGEEKVKDAS